MSKQRERQVGQEEKQQMQRKHIFCVNRDPTFLSFVHELMQDENYNVTTTNFLPETFDQVASLQPSVLIIDLAIGQKAGWDLLERLQQDAVTNKIPVMVVSTDRSLLEDAKADQERYGSHIYVAKPFDIYEMIDGIRRLVGKA